MPNQFFCVADRGWPVKTCSESLSDQRSRCGVIAAGSSVYVFQELNTIILGYALEQYFGACVFPHEFSVDQDVVL
jgi:hypothetical protein